VHERLIYLAAIVIKQKEWLP
jgi:hypothetical protein